MKLTNLNVQAHEELVAEPSSLSKGEVVEQMVVIDLAGPTPYNVKDESHFLHGKSFYVVTGERGDKVESRVVMASVAKAAMDANRIIPVHHAAKPRVGNTPAQEAWVELPDCVFSADGFTQKWEKLLTT